MTTSTKPHRRGPYERPRLRRIKLAADEVMAKGCRIAQPFAARQNTGCRLGNCFENGS